MAKSTVSLSKIHYWLAVVELSTVSSKKLCEEGIRARALECAVSFTKKLGKPVSNEVKKERKEALINYGEVIDKNDNDATVSLFQMKPELFTTKGVVSFDMAKQFEGHIELLTEFRAFNKRVNEELQRDVATKKRRVSDAIEADDEIQKNLSDYLTAEIQYYSTSAKKIKEYDTEE